MQCRICGNQKDNQDMKAEMMLGYRDVFLISNAQCDCLQIKIFLLIFQSFT